MLEFSIRPGKRCDTRRCAYLPRWCASSGKEKSGFCFHFVEITMTVGSSGRGFFPPHLFIPRPVAFHSTVFFSRGADHRSARIASRCCPHDAGALPIPLRSLHLFLFPFSRRPASPRASGGRLCTTFQPWQWWSHPFTANTSLLHDSVSFPKQLLFAQLRQNYI